jgi:hypothetical protein
MTDTRRADLYLDVYGADDTFIMRTTMPVLRKVFAMHAEAVARVQTEIAQPGGVSQVHFNSRGPILGHKFITVQLAIGPRANY